MMTRQNMNFLSLFQLEMLLIPVFVHMESKGIGFSDVLVQENTRIEETLKVLELMAHRIAGTEFNLNEISDISDILYKKLKIPEIQNLHKSFKKYRFQGNFIEISHI